MYHILGEMVQDTGVDYYDQQYQQRKLKHLQKQAALLGFELVKQIPVIDVS